MQRCAAAAPLRASCECGAGAVLRLLLFVRRRSGLASPSSFQSGASSPQGSPPLNAAHHLSISPAHSSHHASRICIALSNRNLPLAPGTARRRATTRPAPGTKGPCPWARRAGCRCTRRASPEERGRERERGLLVCGGLCGAAELRCAPPQQRRGQIGGWQQRKNRRHRNAAAEMRHSPCPPVPPLLSHVHRRVPRIATPRA